MARIREFCRLVVDATEQFAAAFKLNSAFFERLGVDGATVLEATIRYIKDRHPNCLVILDAKRGDIDNTNAYDAAAVFDTLVADVVTVHPYMGHQSLLPFLERSDRGVIVTTCAWPQHHDRPHQPTSFRRGRGRTRPGGLDSPLVERDLRDGQSSRHAAHGPEPDDRPRLVRARSSLHRRQVHQGSGCGWARTTHRCVRKAVAPCRAAR